jgi:hypothetical protein
VALIAGPERQFPRSARENRDAIETAPPPGGYGPAEPTEGRMPELQGTVVLVQEGRLQVLDDQGAAHLFILSHSSGAEPQQLYPLQARQARVRITYSRPRNVIGLLAEKIELMDKEAAA